MDFNNYAPWEHYPKTLNQAEMMDPMSVIEDFFSCNSVKGHKRILKKWRSYVISDKYFNDKRDGPGRLLFEYDINLKLLEASFLLLLGHQNFGYRVQEVPESQLDDEKGRWDYFPKNLSQKELVNPFKVVKKVFGSLGPQQYRDQLHEWLHAALYCHPDFERPSALDLITVYANLVRPYCYLAYL